MIKIMRIVAGFIDFFIILFISTMIGYVFSIGQDTEIFGICISLTLFFTLFLLKDTVFKNASIGKKIFNISIKSNVSSKINLKSLVIRNIFLLPLLTLEILMILYGNRRIGDILAKTSVTYSEFK